MHDWASSVTAVHDRLRRSATEHRLLVLFHLPALPPRASAGGAAVLEAWRWFQNQPGTGAAIVVDGEDGRGGSPDQGAGVLDRLREVASAHELRVPADLFGCGALDLDRWRGEGWTPAVVVDARPGARDADAGPRGSTPAVVAAPELAVSPEGAEVRRRRCEVTWCGVGSREDLDAFLGSTVNSAEIPIARGAHGDVVVAGDEGFAPALEEVLGILAQVGKGARLRLDVDAAVRRRALRVVAGSGFPVEDLRLAARSEDLGTESFAALAEACPGTRIESPLDFLGSVLAVDPEAARALVERLVGQGVSRFLLSRGGDSFGTVASALDEWGADYDVVGLRDLQGLLAVHGTGPAGLSTDFGLASRPDLRRTIDAAMGAAPPVSRARSRRKPPIGGRARR